MTFNLIQQKKRDIYHHWQIHDLGEVSCIPELHPKMKSYSQ
jgi:hypothetical protein